MIHGYKKDFGKTFSPQRGVYVRYDREYGHTVSGLNGKAVINNSTSPCLFGIMEISDRQGLLYLIISITKLSNEAKPNDNRRKKGLILKVFRRRQLLSHFVVRAVDDVLRPVAVLHLKLLRDAYV